MTPSTEIKEAFDRRAERRSERREFFRTAMSFGVAAAGGVAALGMSGQAMAQAAPSDTDILNLALNLEYLEAQFYSYAANGTPLPENILGGTQTRGQVTGGRKAALTDPGIIQYAREIAEDERNHVIALRAALGSVAVAQPALDISPQVFTAAATASGVDLTPFGGVFDPYANDNAFLLGAYVFEDVGVTAYKGAAPLLASADILDAAAGILAAEAFHAGIIRAALYRRGVDAPVLRTVARNISDGRDTLDGTAAAAGPPMRVADDDQGIDPTGSGNTLAANIAPTDANGLAFSRSSEQVHNIVYLTRTQTTQGGFFPAGTNNPNPALRRSGAN